MAGYYAFIETKEPWAKGQQLTLSPGESQHLVRVRRAKEGAPVQVLNGQGGIAHCELIAANARQALLAIEAVEEMPALSPSLILAQAIPKGKMMDTIIRHATEIGVRKIIPLWTENVEVQLDDKRQDKKTQRWQEIAIEACKQAGNPFCPTIAPPQALTDWIRDFSGYGIVGSLEEKSLPIVQTLQNSGKPAAVTCLVGPEGDFSKAEYGQIGTVGFKPVHLCANVLRCETAALYMLATVDACLVDSHR